MKRICVVVATDGTVRSFLLDQLRALSASYQVSVVSNTTDPGWLRSLGVDADVTPIRIERKISLLDDLRALVALTRLFRARGFAAVHSVTPKAGLLTMLAGALAGVPVRIHTFTGQVWATRTGVARRLLRGADRTIAAAATHVLADSRSQRDFLVAQGVVRPGKIAVLGEGSISGVDLLRFRPAPEVRGQVREELGVPADAIVFLFIGRLVRDKGVLDLARAFASCAASCPRAFLVVAGPDEEGLTPRIASTAAAFRDRVRLVGFTRVPERLLAAADVFCLPSYREGFGTAVIEAAAAAVPAIASRIYGLTDAVEEGATGLLHEPGDVAAVAALMTRLASDAQLRADLGERARRRASREFSSARLTGEALRLYAALVGTADVVPRPSAAR